MRCLGRWTCMSASLVGLALLAASPAEAGAWTRPAGEGVVITTVGRRAAPVGALTGGRASEDSNTTQIYLEYGLFEGLTIGATSFVGLSTTDFSTNSAAVGGFVRKRVWQSGQGGVASLQLGYSHPIESLFGATFDQSEPGAVREAHLAALYGHGWADDWGSAFLSTGAAYYLRDGTSDDLRLEVSAGYAPWRRWMGIVSFYGLAPLGPDTDASLKIAPSIAFTMWPKAGPDEDPPEEPVRPNTIQVGVNFDLLNPGDGLGVSLGFWQPF
jgi:hypothetical protein